MKGMAMLPASKTLRSRSSTSMPSSSNAHVRAHSKRIMARSCRDSENVFVISGVAKRKATLPELIPEVPSTTQKKRFHRHLVESRSNETLLDCWRRSERQVCAGVPPVFQAVQGPQYLLTRRRNRRV